MLETYEAIYNGGTLTWVRDRPRVEENRRVLVVVESEPSRPSPNNRFLEVFEESCGAWGFKKSLDEIDRELAIQRDTDWDRKEGGS